MADTKISALTEATTLDGTEDIPVVQTSTKRVGVDTMFSTANTYWQGWVFPYSTGWVGTAGSPLTSTSWDGDSHSTTAKTVIDLSAVFGAPAGIKAALFRAAVRDSASAATADLFLILSPNNTSGSNAAAWTASGQPNDGWLRSGGQVCPCDSNGDCYFQIAASGATTFDVTLEIWGYLL